MTLEAIPYGIISLGPSPVPVRDNQNTPDANKTIFADNAIFKAAVYQTKTAMDHKALNTTQLKMKKTKITNTQLTIRDQVKKSFDGKFYRGKI